VKFRYLLTGLIEKSDLMLICNDVETSEGKQ
jgi:hypothetical protein